jgi:small-conductance mechanosensitive channel
MDWTPVIDWLASHGVRILIILIISAALGFALHRLVPRAIRLRLKKRMEAQPDEAEKRAKTLERVLWVTGLAIIIVAAVFMILSEIGIDITALIAGFGIAGIAIGFGAQYLIRDLIAGFFVLVENQYRVGDVVRVADTTGIVEEINLRRTVLRDLDGIVHTVPNGEIRVASNYTKEWSRVNLNVPVAYGEDLDHVIQVINRVGNEMVEEPYWNEAILKAPQVLRVDAFEDSGIAIKILGDTKPLRQWEAMGELRKRIKKAFDEEGIEIPWPHTKVYFGSTTPGFAAGTPPSQAPPPATEILPPPSEEADD